jgi:hypothetical protein
VKQQEKHTTWPAVRSLSNQSSTPHGRARLIGGSPSRCCHPPASCLGEEMLTKKPIWPSSSDRFPRFFISRATFPRPTNRVCVPLRRLVALWTDHRLPCSFAGPVVFDDDDGHAKGCRQARATKIKNRPIRIHRHLFNPTTALLSGWTVTIRRPPF